LPHQKPLIKTTNINHGKRFQLPTVAGALDEIDTKIRELVDKAALALLLKDSLGRKLLENPEGTDFGWMKSIVDRLF